MLIRIIKPRNLFKSFLVYYTCNFTLFLDTKNLTFLVTNHYYARLEKAENAGVPQRTFVFICP